MKKNFYKNGGMYNFFEIYLPIFLKFFHTILKKFVANFEIREKAIQIFKSQPTLTNL